MPKRKIVNINENLCNGCGNCIPKCTEGALQIVGGKAKIIKETAIHDKDTGSPEVQVAILTKRIDELAGHLKKHKKDNHSRRGLLGMVADRQAHLNYLKKKSPKRYSSIIKKLELKK